MKEFHIKLPTELTSSLFAGRTAWLEHLGRQPKDTSHQIKYSRESTVYIIADKKRIATVETISVFRIKESR